MYLTFRIYRKENCLSKSKQSRLSNTENHPLCRDLPVSEEPKNGTKKPPLSTEEKKNTKRVVTAWDGLDPLSAALSSSSDAFQEPKNERFAQPQQKRVNFIEEDFVCWTTYKGRILSKFNTAEKLSIKSSFLSDKSVVKSTPSISQKVKDRLEELDDIEESSMQEMLNLSQPEYVKRIEELNVALIKHFETDQKVKGMVTSFYIKL